MNILKVIFYATMAWIILACTMAMIISGFTVEKFLLICVAISSILYCYFIKNDE